MADSDSSHKGALSPSMITDYFRSSKPNRRKQGGKPSVKKKHPSSTVYLTPESSPGSLANPESPIKENGYHSDTTNIEVNLTTSEADESLKVSVVSDEHMSSVVVRLVEEKNCEEESECADINQQEFPVKPSVSTSDSPRSPKKCSRQDNDEGAASGHLQMSEAKSSDDCTNPMLATVKAETTSSSPCLPRLKLRKSAKSKSEADAAAVKECEPLKPKPGRRKKKDAEVAQNSFITDFFPVRRSGRQTKSEIEKEKQHQLVQMILSGCEDGLEIKTFENKGRGVVATKDFKRGDFVVEYAGDLIDLATAREREMKYGKSQDIGCYMYYFKCGSKQYCVDATDESGKLGRLLNHSSKEGNCCTRSLEVDGVARLILVAKRDIYSGEELMYDYGDRSKTSLESHPWLKL